MENWNDYRKCVRITKLAWKNAMGIQVDESSFEEFIGCDY